VIIIDEQWAMSLLAEVVSDFGEDHIYENDGLQAPLASCVNVADGQPSCIVGHVLVRAGIPVSTFYENNAVETGMYGTYSAFKNGVADITEGAYMILAAAQRAQDDGHTWGEAYEAAQTVERAYDSMTMAFRREASLRVVPTRRLGLGRRAGRGHQADA
jgi:hypothetical protein